MGNAECVGRAMWHSPRPGHSHGKMVVPTARTPGQKDIALNLGSSRKLSSKAGSGLEEEMGIPAAFSGPTSQHLYYDALPRPG